MTEVIWWWCWRCGFAGTIAAFLLGCWVPPLPMGMWLLPQAAGSTRDGTCAQPCRVGLTGELRKDIDHRTPGRSHGTLGRSYRQRTRGRHLPWAGAPCPQPCLVLLSPRLARSW